MQRGENQSSAAYTAILLQRQDFRIDKILQKLANNNYTMAPKRKNKKNIKKILVEMLTNQVKFQCLVKNKQKWHRDSMTAAFRNLGTKQLLKAPFLITI